MCQFVRGQLGWQHHTPVTFQHLPGDRLRLVSSVCDGGEWSPDTAILQWLSEDGGLSWSAPEPVKSEGFNNQMGVTVSVKFADGDEALGFATHNDHDMEADETTGEVVWIKSYFDVRSTTTVHRSSDGGVSYLPEGQLLDAELVTGGNTLLGGGWYGIIDDAICLESGRVVIVACYLAPASPERDRYGLDDMRRQNFRVGFLHSDDRGYTWSRGQTLQLDIGRGLMEAQMAEIAPNQVLALFRTSAGCVYQSTSTDGGIAWAEPSPTDLPAPESMTRMIRLRSGNLVVVWNNIASTTQRPRHQMAAALSRNGGKTWGKPKVIATAAQSSPLPGQEGDHLSNHALTQWRDGRILLAIGFYRAILPETSDILYAVFDEMWLQEGHPLSTTWKFRTDPDGVGESEGWHQAVPDDQWADIETTRHWTDQGHDYHGTAWYRLDLAAPDASEGSFDALRFGAVDGTCRVYLDGELIGEQSEPPEKMWDRAFVINLGRRWRAGQSHRLAVSVTKAAYSAGMWKPVDFVQSA